MPTEADTASPARAVGPIAVVSSSVLKQLLGLAFVLVGLSLALYGAELLGVSDHSPFTIGFHLAIGSFAILNGLYLGGLRFRR